MYVHYSSLQIIGFDRITAYTREDLSEQIISRLNLKFAPKKGWVYIHQNGAEIHFKFKYQGMTSISFSIPKLLNGRNFVPSGNKEVNKAVNLISEIIGFDFRTFSISRLDIVSNFKSLGDTSLYRSFLQKPLWFKGMTVTYNDIYFHSAQELSKSSRVLVFSNKGEVVRIEARLIRKGHNSANNLLKRYLGHIALISEFLKETFYENIIIYFYNLVKSAIERNNINENYLAEFTLKNLVANFSNSVSRASNQD